MGRGTRRRDGGFRGGREAGKEGTGGGEGQAAAVREARGGGRTAQQKSPKKKRRRLVTKCIHQQESVASEEEGEEAEVDQLPLPPKGRRKWTEANSLVKVRDVALWKAEEEGSVPCMIDGKLTNVTVTKREPGGGLVKIARRSKKDEQTAGYQDRESEEGEGNGQDRSHKTACTRRRDEQTKKKAPSTVGKGVDPQRQKGRRRGGAGEGDEKAKGARGPATSKGKKRKSTRVSAAPTLREGTEAEARPHCVGGNKRHKTLHAKRPLEAQGPGGMVEEEVDKRGTVTAFMDEITIRDSDFCCLVTTRTRRKGPADDARCNVQFGRAHTRAQGGGCESAPGSKRAKEAKKLREAAESALENEGARVRGRTANLESDWHPAHRGARRKNCVVYDATTPEGEPFVHSDGTVRWKCPVPTCPASFSREIGQYLEGDRDRAVMFVVKKMRARAQLHIREKHPHLKLCGAGSKAKVRLGGKGVKVWKCPHDGCKAFLTEEEKKKHGERKVAGALMRHGKRHKVDMRQWRVELSRQGLARTAAWKAPPTPDSGKRHTVRVVKATASFLNRKYVQSMRELKDTQHEWVGFSLPWKWKCWSQSRLSLAFVCRRCGILARGLQRAKAIAECVMPIRRQSQRTGKLLSWAARQRAIEHMGELMATEDRYAGEAEAAMEMLEVEQFATTPEIQPGTFAQRSKRWTLGVGRLRLLEQKRDELLANIEQSEHDWCALVLPYKKNKGCGTRSQLAIVCRTCGAFKRDLSRAEDLAKAGGPCAGRREVHDGTSPFGQEASRGKMALQLLQIQVEGGVFAEAARTAIAALDLEGIEMAGRGSLQADKANDAHVAQHAMRANTTRRTGTGQKAK